MRIKYKKLRKKQLKNNLQNQELYLNLVLGQKKNKADKIIFLKMKMFKLMNQNTKIKIHNKKEINLFNLLKNRNKNLNLRKKKIVISKKIKTAVKMISCHQSIIYKNFLKFLKELQAVFLNLNNNLSKIKFKKKKKPLIKKLMKKY